MLTLQLFAILARLSFGDCFVADWGLDNVHDAGAESVGIACGDALDMLIGPDLSVSELVDVGGDCTTY